MTGSQPAPARAADSASHRPGLPSFLEATRFWFRLGLISFGGPAGQIAIMHEELVVRRRWISERRFLHALNYCMALPGPEAQQLATYIGWLMHRTAGGIVAGGLFVLPSLVILVALSWVYARFGSVGLVAGVFYGLKPAVTAIVAHAAWRIGRRALKGRWAWVIAAVSFLCLYLQWVPFPAVILGAAVVGWLAGRFAPRNPPAPAAEGEGDGTADESLLPAHLPHTEFSWPKLARALGGGAVLWLLPMGAMVGLMGVGGTYSQMGLFFTKAALLTFGGAYAVLPYVYAGAVGQYGWLSAPQMIDGLALGETTPGPLIMIVAFVGFLGGYGQVPLGTDLQFLSGALGAAVATWFTFLPSFVFILAGGPLVEATREEAWLTAPLGGITAAVVGAILSLGVTLGEHALWRAGPDWLATAIALASFVALVRFGRSVVEVIVAAGVAGLLATLAAKIIGG